MQKILLFVSILISVLPACANLQSKEVILLEEYRMPTDVPAPAELTQTVEADIASKIPPADCPVTLPQEPLFKAPKPLSPDVPWEGMFWFGREHLWTSLQTNGVWSSLPHNPDGYTQKIMWWSSLFDLKNELQPELVVFGKRLDAEAPPLIVSRATNAMAPDIHEAMLTGVDFPTLGCWEITGQYKKSGLTFVVWVAP